MSRHLHVGAVFDGEAWRRDAVLVLDPDGRWRGGDRCAGPDCRARRVSVVTPGLVDGGMSFGGYRESAQDSVVAATDSIVALARRHGVSTVRDDGTTWENLYRVRAVGGLDVVTGGPVLTDQTPVHESERQVDRSGLVRSVQVASAEGAAWVGLRTDDVEVLTSTVEAAASAGVRVALRSGVLTGEQAASSGAGLLVGCGHLVPGARPVGGAGLLDAAGRCDPATLSAHARRLATTGVPLTTGLMAVRRGAFLREALQAPGLEDLVPVFPHTRHLIEMRRTTGYLAGRRQLAAHTGLSEPTAKQRAVMLAGWDALVSAVREFHDHGGTLLPASHAPRLAVVPGQALREELVLLTAALGDVTAALTLSTSGARQVLGCTPGGPMSRAGEAVLLTADVPVTELQVSDLVIETPDLGPRSPGG